jgi:trans-aconitate methyltransferase
MNINNTCLLSLCHLLLSLGCHTGHVTFYVAEQFQPRQIVGLDIDQQLVQQARHQLWNHLQTINTEPPNPTHDRTKNYPFNLRFQQVLSNG